MLQLRFTKNDCSFPEMLQQCFELVLAAEAEELDNVSLLNNDQKLPNHQLHSQATQAAEEEQNNVQKYQNWVFVITDLMCEFLENIENMPYISEIEEFIQPFVSTIDKIVCNNKAALNERLLPSTRRNLVVALSHLLTLTHENIDRKQSIYGQSHALLVQSTAIEQYCSGMRAGTEDSNGGGDEVGDTVRNAGRIVNLFAGASYDIAVNLVRCGILEFVEQLFVFGHIYETPCQIIGALVNRGGSEAVIAVCEYRAQSMKVEVQDGYLIAMLRNCCFNRIHRPNTRAVATEALLIFLKNCSLNFAKLLIANTLVEDFVQLLANEQNAQILSNTIYCLDQIFLHGEAIMRDDNLIYNPPVTIFEQTNGNNLLESLQDHKEESVYSAIIYLLKRYWTLQAEVQ